MVAAIVAAAINTVAYSIRSEKHEATGRRHAVPQESRSKGRTHRQDTHGFEITDPQPTHVEGLIGQQGAPQAKTIDMEVDAVWQENADAANAVARKSKRQDRKRRRMPPVRHKKPVQWKQ